MTSSLEMPVGIYEKALPAELSWEERLLLAKEIGYDYVEITIDESEIHDWRWIGARDLDTDMDAHPEVYTPWLKRQWARMRARHWCEVEALRDPSNRGLS